MTANIRHKVEARLAGTRRYIDTLPRGRDGKVGRAYELGLARAQERQKTLEWVLNLLARGDEV